MQTEFSDDFCAGVFRVNMLHLIPDYTGLHVSEYFKDLKKILSLYNQG